MENTIMNNEMDIEVIDLVNEAEVADTTSKGAGKAIGLIVAAGIGAAVVITAIVRKNKGKLTDWRIKRLEKKGYVVTKLEKADDANEGCEDYSEEIEE